jgi:hypothetical protein
MKSRKHTTYNLRWFYTRETGVQTLKLHAEAPMVESLRIWPALVS